MLTDKQVRAIHAVKQDLPHEYIRKFDADWQIRVRRVRNSRADLSRISLVPETTERKSKMDGKVNVKPEEGEKK